MSDKEDRGDEHAILRQEVVKAMTHQYKIGQEVWYVPNAIAIGSNPRKGFSVKITKIGRKWVILANRMRFNKGTGAVDAGEYTSGDACYPSEQAWLEEIVRRNTVKLISERVRLSYMTLDQALGIAEIMGIDISKGSK